MCLNDMARLGLRLLEGIVGVSVDDIVILTHTRRTRRKQLRALSRYFNGFGFCQHADKTFNSRVERGLGGMGVEMNDVGVEDLTHCARVNHIMRWRQLYKQIRMSQYRRKWTIWAMGLCGGMAIHTPMATAYMGPDGAISAAIAAQGKPQPSGRWGGPITVQLTYVPSSYDKSFGNPTGHVNPQGKISDWRFTTLSVTGTTTGTVSATCTVLYGKKGDYNTGVTASYNSSIAMPSNDAIVYKGSAYTSVAGSDNSATIGYANAAPGVSTHTDSTFQPDATEEPVIANCSRFNISFNIDVAIGTTIAVQPGRLYLGISNYGNVVALGLGSGDTTKPSPPVPAAGPVNCTAINGVPLQNDFGIAAPLSVPNGFLQPTKSIPAHNISLSCNAPTSAGSASASATLYVTSGNTKSADSTTLLSSAGDWLGLVLTMPASLPTMATIATGQAVSQNVKWNGSNNTPLWTWNIPARSGLGG
ncbi:MULTISPECIES: hypothetical protein [Enterobacter]|uniref:hypothetical protein n=1 Tax=Enterobacter TaxID=547 RepID=UPI0007AE2CFC|nr:MULTISPECIES: hypothetical protein [Enterobacter]AMZ77782.1 hypothetical protein A4308_12555 [Enterobacter sp. ODB01]VAL43345.1 Uncharacterised protein [Enterobacter kobei]